MAPCCAQHGNDRHPSYSEGRVEPASPVDVPCRGNFVHATGLEHPIHNRLVPLRGPYPGTPVSYNRLVLWKLKWALSDLNRRPTDYESDALTAELKALHPAGMRPPATSVCQHLP